MFRRQLPYILTVNLVLLFALYTSLSAQSNTFTYQGKLSDGSAPASGTYLMQFSLWDAASGGNQIGQTITFDGSIGNQPAVQASNGIFTVQLDFGNPTPPFDNTPRFDGSPRWISIAVRKIGEVTFTLLSPRQPVTSSPYAIRSSNATSSDSLSQNCVLCITDAQIASVDGGKVTGVVSSAQNALNALNATNVTGTVGIANGGTGSNTKNFVDLSTDQSVAGNKTFSGNVSVTGASGIFSGNGSGLTDLNGANIAGGTITTAQLSADAVPNSSSLTMLGSLRWDLLKGQREIGVGNSPTGMAFDGNNMWVVNTNSNTVSKIRTGDGAVIGTFAAGASPQRAAFDGSNVWITDFTATNNVQKMRASDGAIVGTFTVAALPTSIAYDGANMWVQNGNNVTKIRASDGANLGTFAVGSVPTKIVFDGSNIWVSNFVGGNVTKLRASDGANLGTFAVLGFPNGLVFDGTTIWVATSSGLTKLRPSDGANIGSIPFASGLTDIAFDGRDLWSINSSTSDILRIRESDGVVLTDLPVATFARILSFDGRNMWASNANSNVVTILPPGFPQP